MSGRNPATRGARFPFTIELRDHRGRWGAQGGRNTLAEATEYVNAQFSSDARRGKSCDRAWRVREGRRVVLLFEYGWSTS